jgi:hypothetical protein
MDDSDAPVVPGGREEVYGMQSEGLETMVVTPGSFVFCNGKAMRLEISCALGYPGHGQARHLQGKRGDEALTRR